MSRVVALALAVLAASASAAAAAPRLAVIAVEPGADVEGAVRTATAAGFEAVTISVPAVDERAALADVERMLAATQAAWLAQGYADADARLDELQARYLVVLARPERGDLLWQLAFLRGLVALSRAGDGDAARSQRWLMFALELTPERRPERATYPPAVDEAFALAADELSRRVAREIAIRVSPPDARVVIDRVPRVEPSRPRLLRRGQHVVLAEAPGYAPQARLVEVDEAAVQLELAALTGASPSEALAPLAARGLLDLEGASAQRLVRAAAAAAGAEATLAVRARGARWIADDRLGVWRDDVAAALADGGTAPSVPPPPPPPRRTRWLLWGGIGAGVVAAIAVGIVIATRDQPVDQTQIGFEP